MPLYISVPFRKNSALQSVRVCFGFCVLLEAYLNPECLHVSIASADCVQIDILLAPCDGVISVETFITCKEWNSRRKGTVQKYPYSFMFFTRLRVLSTAQIVEDKIEKAFEKKAFMVVFFILWNHLFVTFYSTILAVHHFAILFPI